MDVGHEGRRRSRARSTATRSRAAAGLAALTEVLTPDAYDHLGKLGTLLAEGCQRAMDDNDIPAHTVDLGAKGCVSYRPEPLTNYRDFLETNPAFFYASFSWMVNRGDLHDPGRRGAVDDLACSTPRTTSRSTSTRSASSARSSPADARTSRELPGRPFGPARGASASMKGPPMQEMHRYTQETEDLARAIVDYARARIADLAAARSSGVARGAVGARRRDDHRRGHRRRARRCGSGPRSSRRRRSPPTTRRTSRSSRARRRRRASCSTWC